MIPVKVVQVLTLVYAQAAITHLLLFHHTANNVKILMLCHAQLTSTYRSCVLKVTLQKMTSALNVLLIVLNAE